MIKNRRDNKMKNVNSILFLLLSILNIYEIESTKILISDKYKVS
jgi:hypothetical protein